MEAENEKIEAFVETLTGLQRRMTVTIPAEQIGPAIETRMRALRSSVRLPGFRRGKIPPHVMKQRFGESVLHEIVEQRVSSSFSAALEQNGLRPVEAAQITLGDEKPTPASDLTYTATFEILPEFEPAPFHAIKVKYPVVSFGDADVERMVELLRKSRRVWTEVDRPARAGDAATIDLHGRIDGEPFPESDLEEARVILGEGAGERLHKEIEAQLVGMRPGDQRSIETRLSEAHGRKDLVGKPVQCEVALRRLSEGRLPEVDEPFIRQFGVEEGSMKAFRAWTLRLLEKQRDDAVAARIKDQVIDSLCAQNRFMLPVSLVEKEAQRIRDLHKSQPAPSDAPDDAVERLAERNVKWGLIMSRIVVQRGLQPDARRERDRLEAMAAQMGAATEALLAWYEGRPEEQAGLRNRILEEQVVELILQEAKRVDVPTSFWDLIGTPEVEVVDHA